MRDLARRRACCAVTPNFSHNNSPKKLVNTCFSELKLGQVHQKVFKNVLDSAKVVFRTFLASYEVMRSRTSLLPEREPLSRGGFAGKSITYGRLSPPLSAFNHTLCEQNIKTCPFVCRRRIAVVAPRAAGADAGASSGAGSGRPTAGRGRREFTSDKVLRGVLTKKYGFVLQREEDWRRPRAPRLPV